MKNCFLFDLDGTIVDSREGIIGSLVYSLEQLGIPPGDKERLIAFIGPPIREGYRRLFGLDDQTIERAVSVYRERYGDTGLFQVTVYEGIPKLLRSLRKNGKTVMLATSKPEDYARRIISRIGLDDCFNYIAGCEADGSRSDKAEIINYALSAGGITDRGSVVMIGDKSHDIHGAKTAGVDYIGVLYGFGSREELALAGENFPAETVADLAYRIGLL